LDATVSDEPPGGVALVPPHHNGAKEGSAEPTDARPSRLLRVSLIAALVVLIGLWGYALVYSVMRKDPERLTNREHTTVQHACERAADRLRALPPVPKPPTNETVSARAAAETNVFARMVADTRQVHPAGSAPRVALEKWLDDWDTLLDARRTYAREVLTDKGAELVIPVVGGSPIYVRMNKYATSKALDACTVDALGATNVYAFRKG